MSDGIYILETKDGYRVTYSKRYEDFVTIQGKLIGSCIKEIFTPCIKYDTIAEAMDEARRLSVKYGDTEDGIRFINYGKNLHFDDIVKG